MRWQMLGRLNLSRRTTREGNRTRRRQRNPPSPFDDAGIKAAQDAMKQHDLEGWVAPDDWKTDWNDHCTKYGKEKTLQELLK